MLHICETIYGHDYYKNIVIIIIKLLLYTIIITYIVGNLLKTAELIKSNYTSVLGFSASLRYR